MNQFRKIIEVLAGANVEFILIGGVAAVLHGSTRLTADIDIVYKRSDENIAKLVKALQPLNPYLRGAPEGLPFIFDEMTVKSGLNFTLSTTSGALDLLGEIAGGGTYENLINHSNSIKLYGMDVFCLNLATLIEVKRAAGRPKDLEVIAELKLLLAKQTGG